MRKTQVALAALALVASTAAMADGVKISGIVDAGVASGNSTTTMASGLLAPNFLNFGGSEDLGNGTKAHFMLMNRFSTASGALNSGNMFWASYVGLDTEFGTVDLGKTIDSFWGHGVAKFDVTNGANMGSAIDVVIAHGLSGAKIANAITYASPNMGGVEVSATWSPAANNSTAYVGGNTVDRRQYQVAATYAAGPLTVGAGYASMVQEGYFVGAGYDAGVAKVNALYVSSKAPSSSGLSTDRSSTWGLNAAVPVTGALTLTAGYYDMNIKAAASLAPGDLDIGTGTGKNTSVGAKYALSKRTTLFANYQHVSGIAPLFYGCDDVSNGVGTSAFAGGTNAAVVGVSHAF